MNLNFGIPQIDLSGFGFQNLNGFNMPTAPMQQSQTSSNGIGVAPQMASPGYGSTGSMASPMTAPMSNVASVPVIQPASDPNLQTGNQTSEDKQQQSFGNSLLWNGEGENRSLNYEGLGLIGSGISTLGSLYNSWQQNKLAKESFNFQKGAYETNLANERSSYNAALEDRIRGRYTMNEQNDPIIQQTIDERRI